MHGKRELHEVCVQKEHVVLWIESCKEMGSIQNRQKAIKK